MVLVSPLPDKTHRGSTANSLKTHAEDLRPNQRKEISWKWVKTQKCRLLVLHSLVQRIWWEAVPHPTLDNFPFLLVSPGVTQTLPKKLLRCTMGSFQNGGSFKLDWIARSSLKSSITTGQHAVSSKDCGYKLYSAFYTWVPWSFLRVYSRIRLNCLQRSIILFTRSVYVVPRIPFWAESLFLGRSIN